MMMNDRQRFGQAFNRLAVAVRLPSDQADAATKQVYWQGLEPYPIEAVEQAANTLGQSSQWFPKLAEWRDAAAQAQHGLVIQKALPAHDRGWQDECGTCGDTGWEALTCDGTHRMCGRQREHPAHDYVVACPCRQTNHTWQRRIAEQRERARGRHRASQERGA